MKTFKEAVEIANAHIERAQYFDSLMPTNGKRESELLFARHWLMYANTLRNNDPSLLGEELLKVKCVVCDEYICETGTAIDTGPCHIKCYHSRK